MKTNKLFLSLTLATGIISIAGCNEDNDSIVVGGGNSNGSSLSYIEFNSEYNDNSGSRSVYKEEISIAPGKVTTKYTTIVDSDLKLRDELTTSFILANNFTYEQPVYINNFKLDPNISDVIKRVNNDNIEISYKSRNGKTLNFKDPYTRVDISSQSLSTNSDDTGVRIEDLTGGNESILDEIKALRFPTGSECIVYGETTGDFPYYEFELEDFDFVSGAVSHNTVGNFKNLEDLLADRSSYEPNASDAVIENVGINNKVRAVHFTDEDDDYEYAYVEYQGKVYYASYVEEELYNNNINPNVAAIFCDGYNQVAASFLETQYTKYLK